MSNCTCYKALGPHCCPEHRPATAVNPPTAQSDRVTDLLNANNAELDRRRAVEAELAATRALLEAAGRDLAAARQNRAECAELVRNLRAFAVTAKANIIAAHCDEALAKLAPSAECGPDDPLQFRIDAETKPLHVEIERLRAALKRVDAWLQHVDNGYCGVCAVFEHRLYKDGKPEPCNNPDCLSNHIRAALATDPSDWLDKRLKAAREELLRSLAGALKKIAPDLVEEIARRVRPQDEFLAFLRGGMEQERPPAAPPVGLASQMSAEALESGASWEEPGEHDRSGE